MERGEREGGSGVRGKTNENSKSAAKVSIHLAEAKQQIAQISLLCGVELFAYFGDLFYSVLHSVPSAAYLQLQL